MADGSETRERSIEQISRRTPPKVGDEADPACTALVSRVVEEALPFAQLRFTFRSKKETPAGCFCASPAVAGSEAG